MSRLRGRESQEKRRAPFQHDFRQDDPEKNNILWKIRLMYIGAQKIQFPSVLKQLLIQLLIIASLTRLHRVIRPIKGEKE